MRVLEIRDLSFGYTKEKKIFDQFSLTLDQGEIKVIVGPSGVGKSTLFDLILGRLKPQHGTVEVSSHSLVFQDPYTSFHPSYSIRQQIEDVVSMAGYEALLAKMDLSDVHLDTLPHKLSGGQLQRCSILRALLMRPRLLLLDEPTSALDNQNQLEIMKLIVKHLGDMGILIITHDDALAHWCADEIIRLA